MVDSRRIGEVVKEVYRALYSGAKFFNPDDFEGYRSRVVWVYPMNNGGIVFVRDNEKPNLWWIDIYNPGRYPSFRTGRAMALLCKYLGAEYLASEVRQQRTGVYFEKLGFQKLDNYIYSLKLTEE